MKIEIVKGTGKQPFSWRFRSGGRTTANNETHPSLGNAKRAAKAVVRGIVKQGADDLAHDGLRFTERKPTKAELKRDRNIVLVIEF